VGNQSLVLMGKAGAENNERSVVKMYTLLKESQLASDLKRTNSDRGGWGGRKKKMAITAQGSGEEHSKGGGGVGWW